MTLNGALALRVNDGHSDRHVTRRASGLKFTKTAPGGHQSIGFHLDLPRNTFTDLGPADQCWLYDARTGKTIFGAAYLEQPTPTESYDGQAYDINAQGGMVRANDETRALIYVDRSLDGWVTDPGSASAAQVDTGTDETFTTLQRVRTGFPGGSLVGTNAVAAATNSVCLRAGMNLGGIAVVHWYSGRADANYIEEYVTPTGVSFSRAMNTIPSTGLLFVTDTNFPTGTQAIGLRLRRTGGATNVADDTTWTNWVDLSIIGQRMDRNGTLLTGSGGLVSASQVLASQVVEDLLGRLMTFCDPGTAQVDATTFGIDQLAYPDGAKAAGVLNDLALYEPGFLWEILESSDSGLHRFNYRAWPTTPRYVVSVKDGWRQTGGDVDLCNRITVNWTDALGAPQFLPITAASLGLVGLGYPVDALGSRVKDADPITLPDGKGSAANATQVGGQILADKINPPLAGTVTVRRPVLDLLTGNMVMPWELEPGYLCRVRELGQDLRITQVDYDDDSVSSVLTLGKPSLTTEQRLAKLAVAGIRVF